MNLSTPPYKSLPLAKRRIRLIKRIALGLSSILLGLMFLIFIVATLLEGALKEEIQQALEKQMQADIQLSEVTVSPFWYFPYVAITLNDLEIQKKGSKKSLISAKEMSFNLRWAELIQGKYTVRSIHLVDGTISLYQNSETDNFRLKFKQSQQAKSPKIHFNVRKVRLKNVQFLYENNIRKSTMAFKFVNTRFRLYEKNNSIQVYVDRKMKIDSLALNRWRKDNSLLRNKEVLLDLQVDYDKEKHILSFQPNSTIWFGQDALNLEGNIETQGKKKINLNLQSQDFTFTKAFYLMPRRYEKIAKQYESGGDFSVDITLKGSIARDDYIQVVADYSCKNAWAIHKVTGTKVNYVSLNGRYDTGEIPTPYNGSLSFNDIEGMMNEKPVSGNIFISNFREPYIDLKAKACVNLKQFFETFPPAALLDLYGLLDLDISFKGNLAALKTDPDKANIKLKGYLNFQNVGLQFKKIGIPLYNINGFLKANNKVVKVSNFSLKAGKSNLSLNGQMDDLASFLFSNHHKLKIRGQFHSSFLDLDELLKLNANKPTKKSIAIQLRNITNDSLSYNLNISSVLELDLLGKIDTLVFRDFQGFDVKTNTLIRNKIMEVRNLNMQTLGGEAQVKGKIDVTDLKHQKVDIFADLQNIDIKHFFSSFDNFSQDFLLDKHLEGKLSTQIKIQTEMDNQLDLDMETMNATVNIDLQNGALTKFPPMVNIPLLGKHRELKNVKFGEIQTTFKVENNIFVVPYLEIASNVFRFTIQGEYDIDRAVNFNFQIPMANFFVDHPLSMEEAHSGIILDLQLVGPLDKLKIVNLNKKRKEEEKARKRERQRIQANKNRRWRLYLENYKKEMTEFWSNRKKNSN